MNFDGLSNNEQALLQRGEVRTWSIKEGNMVFVCSGIVLKSPVLEVWDLLADKERTPEYLSGLKISKVVGYVDDKLLVYQETHPTFLAKCYKYTVWHRPIPFRKLEFARYSGDCKHIQGAWIFEELGPNSTYLVYKLHIDPGGFIPQGLVVRTQKGQLPQVLGEIRTELARRAEEETTFLNSGLVTVEGAGKDSKAQLTVLPEWE